MPQTDRHLRRAFTLVELALCISIIGVISVIAIPRYGSAIASYRVRAAAQRVISDVALAQSTARTTSTSQSLVISTTAGGYDVSGQRALDTASPTYRVTLADEPYRCTITLIALDNGFGVSSAVAAGANATITFDGYGNPSSGATIQLRSGNATRTVVIDAFTGKASAR